MDSSADVGFLENVAVCRNTNGPVWLHVLHVDFGLANECHVRCDQIVCAESAESAESLQETPRVVSQLGFD
jgi:hypothetical protein